MSLPLSAPVSSSFGNTRATPAPDHHREMRRLLGGGFLLMVVLLLPLFDDPLPVLSQRRLPWSEQPLLLCRLQEQHQADTA